MRIALDEVDFNHRLNAATGDGLSVRVNRIKPAAPWTPGGPASPAAFALAATRADAVTVKATFSFSGPSVAQSSIKVRTALPASSDAVLGAIPETSVALPPEGAATITVTLPLSNINIWDSGVGRYACAWQWQVQWSPNGAWTTFATSEHTVYVTLDLPTDPWTVQPQGPDQFAWPWTEVLDFSCAWAAGIGGGGGEVDLEALNMEAARRVEAAINALGTRRRMPVRYGGAKFTDARGAAFQVTDFIELLRGRSATGPHGQPLLHSMNCSDCAAAVTTFANVLGCRLSTQRLQKPRHRTFDTNPILPIGNAVGQTKTFVFHEMAIGPGSTADDRPVHDACLSIDFDANPRQGPPATFRLAAGLPRGTLGANAPLNYVQRFMTDSAGVRGATMNPRALDQGLPGAISDVLLDAWDSFKERIDQLIGPPHGGAMPLFPMMPFALSGFVAEHQVASPWQLSLMQEVMRSVQFLYTARNPVASGDQIVRVLVGVAETERLARDAFAWLLTQAHEPMSVLDDVPQGRPARVVFIASEETTAYVLRGQLFARVSSEGEMPVDLAQIVQHVDAGFRVAIA